MRGAKEDIRVHLDPRPSLTGQRTRGAVLRLPPRVAPRLQVHPGQLFLLHLSPAQNQRYNVVAVKRPTVARGEPRLELEARPARQR